MSALLKPSRVSKKDIGKILKFVLNRSIEVKQTHFDGSPKSEILGLLYLTNFHSNGSTLLSGIKLSKLDNLNFNNYSITWKCSSKKGNKGKLMIPKDVIKFINGQSKIISNTDTIKRLKSTRFCIIFLDIKKAKWTPNTDHANVLIFDRQGKEFERFEPHGCKDLFDYRLLDMELDQLAKILNWEYRKPTSFLPTIGIQSIQEKERMDTKNERKGDPSGFCSIWCLYWIDFRLSFPDINKELLMKSLLVILEKEKSYTDYIRGYSEYMFQTGKHLHELRKNLL